MRRLVLGLLLAGMGWSASCTFPDVLIAEGEGGAGGVGGARTTTTTTTTTTSAGGSPAGGTGGTGSGGNGSAGAGGCVDADGDLEFAPPCGEDCNDNDDEVFPSQSDYFPMPIGGLAANGFDYNCDDADEPEFDTVACTGTVCALETGVFFGSQPRPCGDTAEWGNCGLTCGQTVTDPTKRIRCR